MKVSIFFVSAVALAHGAVPASRTTAQALDAGLDGSLESEASVPASDQPDAAAPETWEASAPIGAAPAGDDGALDVAPAVPPETRPFASAEPPFAPPVEEPPPEVVEVEVRTHSRAGELRRSSLAVGVIELREARRATADLGEVLARSEGVAVRRAGGLGSDQRFSLAGLEGEQIRFFLDGVPLELQGYPFGVSNVPVNAIERVDIYRGVVPIAFGADALGGAVNLVTGAPKQGTHGSASYQGGSFDTHRGTLEGSVLRRGVFAKAQLFADGSANDYPIDVLEAEADGTPYRVRVRRFHDAYRAEGGNLTIGAVDRPWARRLVLRGFGTEYEREIQHDVLMNKPYGALTAGGWSSGASLSYAHTLFDALELDTSAGYTYWLRQRRDMARCIYNWFGHCTPTELRSEIDGVPEDVRLTQHVLFVRSNAAYVLGHGQTVRLALAPTHFRRGGEDRYEPRPGSRDPLDVDRRLTSLVLGLEYALRTLGDELELTGFGKAYLQWVRSEELLRDGENSVRRDQETRRLGAGLSSRYALGSSAWLKASYEYATRLPSSDEVFGDGIQIDPNLELRPELSHNGNLSIAADHVSARAGRFAGEAGAFLRDADRLIWLTGNDTYRYENVARARSLGGMASASWTARQDVLHVAGNVTYQSFRNLSEEGTFARAHGDRMANQPYLFANGSARGQLRGLFGAGDTLALAWSVRYTHSFFRAWESLGRVDTKDVIPRQLVHSMQLSHLTKLRRNTAFSVSLEVQNLTNERVYDFFGVQKPGRAVFAKAVAEL